MLYVSVCKHLIFAAGLIHSSLGTDCDLLSWLTKELNRKWRTLGAVASIPSHARAMYSSQLASLHPLLGFDKRARRSDGVRCCAP
jgi:hypothetical protein